MDADKVQQWAREAGLDWHRGWTLDEEENRYVRLARLARAAAFEEAKERISELRRGCSLCEGQYLHDQCDSIGDEVTHDDYIDAIEALAAREKEPGNGI